MERPTLAEVIEQFRAATGADAVGPDTPVTSIDGIDSLDLVEWLYEFQQAYPDIPADESLLEDVDETVTLRTLYAQIMETAPAASTDA
jgi:acyl carrier protein